LNAIQEAAKSAKSARSQRDDLLKTAADRLHPSLTNPNFLILRSRRKIFQLWIANLEDKELTILDIGGRYQPYRPLFAGRIGRYVACDILQTNAVDVVGSGEALPFSANSFDVVIATQVFDYFPRPHLAAVEIHAALKPGGALLMSVPSLAPRFADNECWRFTPAGILATLSMFGKVEIVPETSSLGGLLRTANLGLHTFARYRPLQKLHTLTTCPCLNLLGMALENMKLTRNDQFTPNYSVLAIK
jgi:SAM-dependent methyltransferase